MSIQAAGAALYLMVFGIICTGLAYQPLIMKSGIGEALLIFGLISFITVFGIFAFSIRR